MNNTKLKIIIIGTELSGKSFYIKRIKNEPINDNIFKTHEIEFTTKCFKTNNNKFIDLELWEISKFLS